MIEQLAGAQRRPLFGVQRLQAFQRGLPLRVVHAAAIVRVGQAEVPQFGALVDVRHPRRGELEQLLGQAVQGADPGQGFLEGLEIAQEGIAGLGRQQLAHEGPGGFLILGVRVEPGTMHLGFAAGLEHVGLDPAGELGQALGIEGGKGPHPQEGLVQEILVIGADGLTGFLLGPVQPAPASDGLGPGLRPLGKHADAGPHISRALAVVGGTGQHGVRPAPSAFLVLLVEGGQGGPEAARVAAHFVQGNQPVVLVEGGVFQGLGHYRAAVLLELQGKGQHGLLVGLALALALAQQQDIADEVEQAGIHRQAVLPGHAGGPFHVADILLAGLEGGHVGAIHRIARHHPGQGLAQADEGEVAGAPVALGQTGEPGRQHLQFAGQQGLHDQVLVRALHGLEIGVFPDEGVVEFGEAGFSHLVDEDPVTDRGEVVAGGAMDRPGLRQVLVQGQDLFHHQIQRQGLAFRVPGGVLGGQGLQAFEILPGIQQAIRMIDPQPVQAATRQPFADQAVGALEHLRIIHVQGGQGVDIKEAAIVDLVGGHPPVGQAVGLGLQQAVHGLEGGNSGPGTVESGHFLEQELGEIGAGRKQGGQTLLVQFLVPAALGHGLGADLVARRQVAEGGEQGLQFQEGGMPRAQTRFQPGQVRAEDARILARVHREAVLAVEDTERTLLRVEGELESTVLQDRPVAVAEHRQQHPAPQLPGDGMPVDVEIGGKGGGLAVFQHVQPPVIIIAHDAHVVGHHVHDLAHAPLLQGRGELLEVLGAGYFRVQAGVVGDVVAVPAAGPRLEQGREVAVADAELVQVGQQCLGLLEGEIAVHLQTVGRPRDPGANPAALQELGAGAARAFLAQRLQDAFQVGVAGPGLQVHRQFQAPAGIGRLHAARQIRLLAHPETVFQLQQQHLRGRSRQVGVDRGGQGRGHLLEIRRMQAAAGRHQPFAFQGQQHVHTVLGPFDDLLPKHLVTGIQVQPLPQIDIQALPEAGQGRQIVAADRRHGLARVGLGGLHAAILTALEGQDPGGKHARGLQGLTNLLRNRAQVLPHHHAGIALAFQGENAQEIGEGVGDIGAFAHGQPLGHPEQAGKPHDVVHAQAAGDGHVGAQQFDEGPVFHGGQVVGNPGGQAPVLAHEVDPVRGGADGGADGEQVALRPGGGATVGRADGQVQQHPEAQPQFPGTGADSGQLLSHLPLQVFEIFHPFQVSIEKGGDLDGLGIPVGLRPDRPAPDLGILLPEGLLQGVEEALIPQALALGGLEGPEPLAPGRAAGQLAAAEMLVQKVEDIGLEGGDPDIIHLLGGPQGAQQRLEGRRAHQGLGIGAFTEVLQGFHLQVQGVEVLPVGGTVGAGMLGLILEARVQRVHQHRVGAGFGAEFQHPAQIPEIADAPVAVRTQAVELGGKAPDAPFAPDHRGLVTGHGRHDVGHLALAAGPIQAFHPEPVVAGLQGQGQHQHAADQALAINPGVPGLLQGGGGELALILAAGFPQQPPAVAQVLLGQRQGELDPVGLGLAGHLHGWQGALPGASFQLEQRPGEFLLGPGRHAHGLEQRALHGLGGFVAGAPGILEFGQHAIVFAEGS